MKYKVGDRVLVNDGYFGTTWVGVIAEVNSTSNVYPYAVHREGELFMVLPNELFAEKQGQDPLFPNDYIVGKVADR